MIGQGGIVIAWNGSSTTEISIWENIPENVRSIKEAIRKGIWETDPGTPGTYEKKNGIGFYHNTAIPYSLNLVLGNDLTYPTVVSITGHGSTTEIDYSTVVEA